MMITLQSYVRKSRQWLHRLGLEPRLVAAVQMLAHFAAGFVFSAAGIAMHCMPLAMGLVCVCRGWFAVAAALGSALGYRLFWGVAGYIGVCWLLAGLPVALVLADRSICRRTPLLLPAVGALIVSASGVVFQLAFYDTTPIGIYLLRVALGGGVTMLFQKFMRERDTIVQWLAEGCLVLALAQLVPIPYLGFGYIAAGVIAGLEGFPAAAIAGLALDIAQITPVPMTVVLCFGYLVRFLPRSPKWLTAISPVCTYVGIMALLGVWDLQPMGGLLAGSLVAALIPARGKFSHRRGETGVAQVRLELAAEVLTQTENLLQEVEPPEVDEEALMVRAAERACGSCAYRKNCRDCKRLQQLPSVALHKPLLTVEELPIICRKPGRYLAELHRCQEQLRSIHADRERQKEYRAAMIQQYRFLAAFLHDLADQLPRKAETVSRVFRPEVSVYGNRAQGDNGDRCLWFSGVGKKYYVLLCDGMGKGLGAVQEGKTAASVLKRMLCAGYPAEHALRSLNSLCALRDRAGAVTVDLAEVMLDTGKVKLYKWGAAPSYVIGKLGTEKLGTTTPPPGIFVTCEQEQVEQTSLRRGERLVMVSDGVGQRETLQCCMDMAGCSPGELAAAILTCGQMGGQDDATVVILKLNTAL